MFVLVIYMGHTIQLQTAQYEKQIDAVLLFPFVLFVNILLRHTSMLFIAAMHTSLFKSMLNTRHFYTYSTIPYSPIYTSEQFKSE